MNIQSIKIPKYLTSVFQQRLEKVISLLEKILLSLPQN